MKYEMQEIDIFFSSAFSVELSIDSKILCCQRNSFRKIDIVNGMEVENSVYDLWPCFKQPKPYGFSYYLLWKMEDRKK